MTNYVTERFGNRASAIYGADFEGPRENNEVSGPVRRERVIEDIMDISAVASRIRSEKVYNIRRALSEACYWGRSIEENQKKPSDQRWIENFSTGIATITDLKKFFPTYQINRASWKFDDILGEVNRLHGEEGWTPVAGVSELAKSLASTLEDTADGKSLKDGDRTSAATKIAIFARPADNVFIWDRLARVAAGLRTADRRGLTKTVGYSVNGAYGYREFHSDCLVELQTELENDQFKKAVEDFMAFTEFTRSGRNSPGLACRSYFERRLFDKLLVCEGQRIEEIREAGRPPQAV
ncbi:hypothetical protein [Rhizobium leguminosarum]|uniref:hypothetical protein n=1 Tax=Rhizobium leguminosarum TaxID=384 RepID=UPI0010395C80|nr:hypothetical protein [Rhizobium leguminosarum]TBY27433.1 hypothetical protein E0H55_27465 [Rhizobium leguminosarum bv. viciae]